MLCVLHGERALPFFYIFWNGWNFIGASQIEQLLREDLDLSAWGWQRILFRVTMEVGKRNGRLGYGSCPGAQILFKKLSEGWQLGETKAAEFVQAIFRPAFFIAAFRKGFPDSQSFRQLGTDPI